MEIRRYSLEEWELKNVVDYLDDLCRDGEGMKIANTRGLLIYHLNYYDGEAIKTKEDVTLILDLLSKKVIAGGSSSSFGLVKNDLECAIRRSIKIDGIDKNRV
jgi:hypothetical protein